MSDTIPISIDDPINEKILSVSEDRVQGFTRRPFQVIADESGVELDTVVERIRAMLEAGVIRRVRQTLVTTSLAPGALVAWCVPEDRLSDAFEWVHENDPFTGHVVIRTTDTDISGARYRLWTTLKVPVGFSMDAHCQELSKHIGAEAFRLMPAKKLFALGVGHVRRRKLEPGARDDELGRVIDTDIVPVDDADWPVLMALKRELDPEEITADPWAGRAEEAGVSVEKFCETAERLDAKGVIGRFSTFLEHVKKLQSGERVTKFNALFHWRVPPGKEIDAGREVGRHHIMTHAYWREGGPEFANVNIMGVAHSTDKELLLGHKEAIDEHLAEAGIDWDYTNVFWGGRSEIKPSEFSPIRYRQWCGEMGLEPAAMKA
ncbi:MAG: Lrp/AsnC family transcriptional regulator [Phycisphaeraceae bacterium]|nr:Lrp/AsnC family transcriptional regulator [Phycisphaeraceae bacterium]